jgi:hypothetical protein
MRRREPRGLKHVRDRKSCSLRKVRDACRRHARYRFTRTEIRHSRFGSSAQNLPDLSDDEKTIVSIGSKPTGESDDWPLLLIPSTSFTISLPPYCLPAPEKLCRDQCPHHMLRCIRLSLPMSQLGQDRPIPPSSTMSASLIGQLGSSAFRLSTSAASTSLAGACVSPESAHRPFHHGIRGMDGFAVVSRTENVPNPGWFRHSDGVTPVQGMINEVVLRKK